jgi:hypothetical protein
METDCSIERPIRAQATCTELIPGDQLDMVDTAADAIHELSSGEAHISPHTDDAALTLAGQGGHIVQDLLLIGVAHGADLAADPLTYGRQDALERRHNVGGPDCLSGFERQQVRVTWPDAHYGNGAHR